MKYDVIIVGSGFGSLTAAALLVKRGLRVAVLEQAKYAGGCSSSFKRKGYWFETGATTLVGLDKHMPLHYLLNELQLTLPVRKLEIPMQVHLQNGEVVTRYPHLPDWIKEAERVFGKQGQRAFWEHCYKVSQGVWQTSLEQQHFPISSFGDVLSAMKHARPHQLKLLPGAFRTMQDVLKKYGLLQNRLFVDFVNEQLLITAQNYLTEVNELFGATALCYTLYSNYYIDGGLINLVKPITTYIKANGSDVFFRQKVTAIAPTDKGYKTTTEKEAFESRFVVSGIPLNNTLDLFSSEALKARQQSYLMPSELVNSAFTMGMVLKGIAPPAVLHHQVHLPTDLPAIKSKSIFVSFSHPDDSYRSAAGETVVAISTHVTDPANTWIHHKAEIESYILQLLDKKGLVPASSVQYSHSATPGAWLFWTQRAFGMVGGYPQYRHIKPWQMKDARLDHKGAYVCGDTVYPGQGIPGVCLSGILAANKLLGDHFL
ncbi:NAD(P)/FAD-dependent oxidoreductase [Pontibacter sp. SGAir0037]|uniref:phytoene desaturase family protein n=1 Tax=Pontibacter sp. SGAir0037 TaxID=2571030 RepID=UPI0010CD4661|nr:NAD(P)/FAD-dependent oxidoreductase [Pontibacter sp. SGAir0037]QCR21778.1 amine oxidase [Pontibacter sp. SGAir0037]